MRAFIRCCHHRETAPGEPRRRPPRLPACWFRAIGYLQSVHPSRDTEFLSLEESDDVAVGVLDDGGQSSRADVLDVLARPPARVDGLAQAHRDVVDVAVA